MVAGSWCARWRKIILFLPRKLMDESWKPHFIGNMHHTLEWRKTVKFWQKCHFFQKVSFTLPRNLIWISSLTVPGTGMGWILVYLVLHNFTGIASQALNEYMSGKEYWMLYFLSWNESVEKRHLHSKPFQNASWYFCWLLVSVSSSVHSAHRGIAQVLEPCDELVFLR